MERVENKLSEEESERLFLRKQNQDLETKLNSLVQILRAKVFTRLGILLYYLCFWISIQLGAL